MTHYLVNFEKSPTVIDEHFVVLLYFDYILCVRRVLGILNVHYLAKTALINDIPDLKSIFKG